MQLAKAIEKVMEENGIDDPEKAINCNFDFIMKRAMVLYLQENKKIKTTGINKGKYDFIKQELV